MNKLATPAHHQMQKRHVHIDIIIITKPNQVIIRYDNNFFNENQVVDVMRHSDDDVLVTWSLVVTWW